jgi:hypothetical protein
LDGSLVAINAGYVAIDGGISALVDPNLVPVPEPPSTSRRTRRTT